MGRKSKLTEKITRKICEHLRNGLPLSVAASACKIPPSTAISWYSRGCKDPDGNFYDFAVKVDQARAYVDVKHVNIITTEAEKGDWRASQFVLAHHRPEIWGQKQQVEHSGQVAHTVQPAIPEDVSFSALFGALNALRSAEGLPVLETTAVPALPDSSGQPENSAGA